MEEQGMERISAERLVAMLEVLKPPHQSVRDRWRAADVAEELEQLLPRGVYRKVLADSGIARRTMSRWRKLHAAYDSEDAAAEHQSLGAALKAAKESSGKDKPAKAARLVSYPAGTGAAKRVSYPVKGAKRVAGPAGTGAAKRVAGPAQVPLPAFDDQPEGSESHFGRLMRKAWIAVEKSLDDGDISTAQWVVELDSLDPK